MFLKCRWFPSNARVSEQKHCNGRSPNDVLWFSVPLPYTIPHETGSSAGSIVNDADEDEDLLQQERYTGDAVPPSALDVPAVGRFTKLLPTAVGQKVKTAILGKRNAEDESDDEDEDSPHSPNENGTPGSNGYQNDGIDRQVTQSSGATKDGQVSAQQGAERKNYNTFGWDSDIEGVKNSDSAQKR